MVRNDLTSIALIQGPIAIAIIHITLPGVAPPRRERFFGARSTEDSEGEDEDHHLRTTIECTTKDIVVLFVPTRMVTPQPYLGDDTDDHGGQHSGINAGSQVRGILNGKSRCKYDTERLSE